MNAAVQCHPIQCLPFLCNTYHRQPSVRFMERLVYRRNMDEQYGGYNLFQYAEFKANDSIKVHVFFTVPCEMNITGLPYGNPSRKMGIFLRCFIYLIFFPCHEKSRLSLSC